MACHPRVTLGSAMSSRPMTAAKRSCSTWSGHPLGRPEWDLVHTAIKWTSFGMISEQQYAEFCAVYGHDVMAWEGFELLRDIREFRMTTMAVQVGAWTRCGRPKRCTGWRVFVVNRDRGRGRGGNHSANALWFLSDSIIKTSSIGGRGGARSKAGCSRQARSAGAAFMA